MRSLLLTITVVFTASAWLGAAEQTQMPETPSFVSKLPTITIERAVYIGTAATIAYCGYKVLSNETFMRNFAGLYNLVAYGDIESPAKRADKVQRRKVKDAHRAQTETTLAGHSQRLAALDENTTTIITDIRELKNTVATQEGLAALGRKLDALAGKVDVIVERTRTLALAEAFFNRHRLPGQGTLKSLTSN